MGILKNMSFVFKIVDGNPPYKDNRQQCMWTLYHAGVGLSALFIVNALRRTLTKRASFPS